MNSKRSETMDALREIGPNLASSMTFLHQAIADFAGLNVTDLRCIETLRSGALTAGQLSDRTGLTTGATTRLIDRLENAGYVRRLRSGTDRRQVMVDLVPERLDALAPLYDGVEALWERVFRHRPENELTMLAAFLSELDQQLREQIAQVRDVARSSGEG